MGEFIHNNGGGMKLENANVHNFIEGVLEDTGGNDITKASWPITGIALDSSNGEAQVSYCFSTCASPVADQIVNGDTIIIGSFPLYGGPPAFNGRWIVECTHTPYCNGTFDLKNSSYTGPSYTASWAAGGMAISVPDTAYIGAGQYLCTATQPTPPFCSTPSSFSATSATLLTAITGTTNKPLVQVSTTAGWPQSGLVCIPVFACTRVTAEFMAYYIVDATHIQITQRGVEGTTAASHASTATLKPCAPMVVAVLPSLNKVVVNATPATPSSANSVEFLNDTYFAVFSTDCIATTSTCALLNANYHTWTGKEEAGASPDGRLSTTLTSISSNVLTVPGNIFKLQPGMVVYDQNLGAYLQDSNNNPIPVQSVSVSMSQVTLNSAPVNTPAANDSLLITGCGYPGFGSSSAQPWLGNCAATAYLFYGIDNNHGGAGTSCNYLHSHGWRIYMHMNNGQETVCSNMVFDSGSGGTASGGIDNNDTADPTSLGIWIEGDGDKIELADGKVEAWTGFLNTGTTENNGVGLSNMNVTNGSPFSLVFANSGRSNISQLHGSASGAGYADSTELGLFLTANDLDSTALYYDDPTKLAALHCANNSFATPFCSKIVHPGAAGAVPIITSGAGNSAVLNGNDGSGRITTGGSSIGASIVLTFATAWASPPVCMAQDETHSANNPVTATPTVTSVTFASAGASNFGSGDNISYQCVGYK